MKTTHVFANTSKGTTVPEALAKYVAGLAELPKKQFAASKKTSWSADGVPAGEYTDPSTPEAERAVRGAYRAMGGLKVSRRLIAVALNFQTSDHVDSIRDRIYDADDEKGKPTVDRGARGRSAYALGMKLSGKVESKEGADKTNGAGADKKAANGNGRKSA